jgi:hypothetical protein
MQTIAYSRSKVFRPKSTVVRYSSCSTDNVGYLLKQLGRQGHRSSYRLVRHLRPYLVFPNLAQLFERCTKQLQRVVDVQHIKLAGPIRSTYTYGDTPSTNPSFSASAAANRARYARPLLSIRRSCARGSPFSKKRICTSLTDRTAEPRHRRNNASRRTRVRYGPDSDRNPSSCRCCRKRNALITDTLAARANCDAFLYCPRGAESRFSGISDAKSTFNIH